jgi:hypothetical protein
MRLASMGFRNTRDAHRCWLSFRDKHARLVSETGLPAITFQSETRFRNLLGDGYIRSVSGEDAMLDPLNDSQWSALERFADLYFRDFESCYAGQFLSFSKEVKRRGSGFPV